MFVGLCSNFLSTDAHCSIIILSVQCDTVDFASRGPSALYLFKMAAVRHLAIVSDIFVQPTESTWCSLSLCTICL